MADIGSRGYINGSGKYDDISGEYGEMSGDDGLNHKGHEGFTRRAKGFENGKLKLE